MPTVAKNPAPKTAVRRKAAKQGAARVRRSRPAAPVPPPPAKGTAGDLLKIREFGKGVNWALVEAAVADRAR